jgi:hypothetical protein
MNSFVGTNLRCPSGLNLPAALVQKIDGGDRTVTCQQLWKDVIRVGSDPTVKGHFLGSVVYVAAEDNTANCMAKRS